MWLGAFGLVGGHSGRKETIENSVEHTSYTHHVIVDCCCLEYCSSDDPDSTAIRFSITTLPAMQLKSLKDLHGNSPFTS